MSLKNSSNPDKGVFREITKFNIVVLNLKVNIVSSLGNVLAISIRKRDIAGMYVGGPV